MLSSGEWRASVPSARRRTLWSQQTFLFVYIYVCKYIYTETLLYKKRLCGTYIFGKNNTFLIVYCFVFFVLFFFPPPPNEFSVILILWFLFCFVFFVLFWFLPTFHFLEDYTELCRGVEQTADKRSNSQRKGSTRHKPSWPLQPYTTATAPATDRGWKQMVTIFFFK